MTPDEKTVVFNSFNGKTYGCSPKAVYEYMLTQDEFKDWTFIWAFKNAKKHRFLEENPNTIVVKQTARVYEKKLIRAKYWITNYRVPDHVWPQKDQVYVQCWHGTPLKTLGKRMRFGIESMYNVQHNFLHANYIMFPNEFTRKVIMEDYNLEALYTGTVVMNGYPRNSIFMDHEKADHVTKKLGNEAVSYTHLTLPTT